jgi:hypothetical protein
MIDFEQALLDKFERTTVAFERIAVALEAYRLQPQALPDPAPDIQPSVQRTAGAPKDPTKATLNWFKGKQWIKNELIEERPPVTINGGIWTPNNIYEYRIKKTAAFIYRGLVETVENREISLGKDAITDFMINNLRKKYGGDITQDLLTKAEKRRQN